MPPIAMRIASANLRRSIWAQDPRLRELADSRFVSANLRRGVLVGCAVLLVQLAVLVSVLAPGPAAQRASLQSDLPAAAGLQDVRNSAAPKLQGAVSPRPALAVLTLPIEQLGAALHAPEIRKAPVQPGARVPNESARAKRPVQRNKRTLSPLGSVRASAKGDTQ